MDHRRCHKRQQRHRCGTPRVRQRFHGRRIRERRPCVDQRLRVGDWEDNTIVGKGLARLVSVVDRKSSLALV